MGEEVTTLDMFSNADGPCTPTFAENMKCRVELLLHKAEILRGNLQDKVALRRHLQRVMPDFVVHLAGMSNAQAAQNEPAAAFQSIVMATQNLLEEVRDIKGLRKFVYVSSSMVYGNFESFPLPETAEKAPREIYGSMKLASEILVKSFCQRFGIPFLIIRPSAVYGPTNNNRSVLQILVEKATRAELITVMNPDSTFLDFTYVKDLAHGLAVATLSSKASDTELNLTRGEGRSLGQAVGILKHHFRNLQVHSQTGNDFRPTRGALDIRRARQLIDYDPQYSLEKGLGEYIAFVRDHNKSLHTRPSPKPSAHIHSHTHHG
jgi:nucleoside-diphosphate-sugar epimerase